MSEVKGIATKIAKVMDEVKYIQKTGFNSFHKYKYATEADVNEKVREELAKLNVAMMPSVVRHEMRNHTNRNGATEYITMVDMEFTFIDGDSGETITINMSGEGQDAGDKGIYKAISGAQKYALMKVFMIPTGDDPEADPIPDSKPSAPTTTTPKPPKPATPNPTPTHPKQVPETPVWSASDAQIQRIFTIGRENGTSNPQIKRFLIKNFGIDSTHKIKSQADYDRLCGAIAEGLAKEV